MSPMPAETVTELDPTPTLVLPAAETMAHERCDQCGHRAYVMTMTADGALAWCAHHYAEHAIVLASRAAVIHDIRAELTPTNRTMG